MLKLPSYAERRLCHSSLLYYRLHIVPSHADFCRTLLQFTDVMNLMNVANVSIHLSMPKEDILAFTAPQEYTQN